MDYVKGPQCGIENCKSRKYYFEDGLKFCKNGHQQEGQQTQPEEDDYATAQGRTSRQKREAQEKISKKYSGQRALELYLQCYQLILWKQCFALIHTLCLPSELENTIKDLWALRLQLLRDKITNQNTDMVFSSQVESDTDAESKSNRGHREWKTKDKKLPGLIESLGLCYLGTILLRFSISLGEIYSWAIKEVIPFIRAIRHVPTVMKSKLPAHYIKSLDTQSILVPDHLRESVHELLIIFSHRFNIEFPPLNHPLLTFKHVRLLALPLQVYKTACHISELLDIDFSFPKPGTRQKAVSFPEIQVMALLIVAVKLYHPFDSLDRYPDSRAEPGLLVLDWKSWNESQSKYSANTCPPGKICRGNEVFVTEHDIMNMSGEQLDNYLDWSEKTWVDENHEPLKHGLPKQILDMFPLGRIDGSSSNQPSFIEEAEAEELFVNKKLTDVQGHLRMRDVVPDEYEGKSKEPVRRIGSSYKRYRRIEDLSPQAKIFYEKAAALISTSLSVLIRAVSHTERQLQLLRVKQMREEMRESPHEESDQEIIHINTDDESTKEREAVETDDKSEITDDSLMEMDSSS